jgi:hypothetical protein
MLKKLNVRCSPNFFVCAIALAIPTLSQAHFLWVTPNSETKTISIGFQEVPEQSPLPLGQKAGSVGAWSFTGKKVELSQEANWLRSRSAETCVAASLDYGVVDRRSDGRGRFWLKYYAKGATTPVASESRLNMPVELLASVSNEGNPIVMVLKNGEPASGVELVVEDAQGKTTYEGKTGSRGTAILPITRHAIEVRALITDKTPGFHGGKPYDFIRTYSTLVVADPVSRSMTQLLRDSFGDMHDVVSQSLFINTLMAGRLTKSQLEEHLQQRAVIHEAIDRILRRGHLKPALYGNPQTEVIALLRNNLQSLGSPWPDDSVAWPITRNMLIDIEDSTEIGPYYALGVFHVYYGGITHGGRDIGALIDQQLNTKLTYYEKSDGYDDYARAVNQIVNPLDQQQMIRGADDAYHFIIAINNSKIFGSTPH